MILLIDLHDSYAPNFSALLGDHHVCVTVFDPEDHQLHTKIADGEFSHIIIGSGPGNPEEYTGIEALFHAAAHTPVLGIGMGHLLLAQYHGATLGRMESPAHGIETPILHRGEDIFTGLESPTTMVRYQSWEITSTGEHLKTLATRDAGVTPASEVMSFKAAGYEHYGVQFHPESVLSTQGQALLANFLGDDRLYTRKIPGRLNTVATAAAQSGEAVFWLDSSSADRGQGRYSILGSTLGDETMILRAEEATGPTHMQTNGTTTVIDQPIMELVTEYTWRIPHTTDLPVFPGGWVGYVGYEANLSTVTGTTQAEHKYRSTEPDAYWVRPQTFIIYDHQEELTTLVAVNNEKLLDDLEATLVFGDPEPPAVPEGKLLAESWRLSDEQYGQRIEEIFTALAEGHSFGVCLTDRYEMVVEANGFELYQRLRHNNPAPYSAYLRFNSFGDELEILCASPERFIQIDQNRVLESKPIKGTIARSADPDLDEQRAQQLRNDPKTRSENLMIADLLRADVAQVAVPGSVRTPKIMDIESYATVHQMVSTVQAELRPDVTVADVLAALLPGGSMTGIPKPRTLRLLNELEAGPRGIYSGAVGWWGSNGTADFNVVIRSIVKNGNNAYIGAGGAVVQGSDVTAEIAEKHLKAQAALETIHELQMTTGDGATDAGSSIARDATDDDDTARQHQRPENTNSLKTGTNDTNAPATGPQRGPA